MEFIPLIASGMALVFPFWPVALLAVVKGRLSNLPLRIFAAWVLFAFMRLVATLAPTPATKSVLMPTVFMAEPNNTAIFLAVGLVLLVVVIFMKWRG